MLVALTTANEKQHQQQQKTIKIKWKKDITYAAT